MKKIFIPVYVFIILSAAALSSPAVAGDVYVQLQIPLPGIDRSLPVCTSSGSEYECTGIAQYIAFLYRWLVGFSAVLAALALTYGGVRWLLSGGESGKIQEAQKVIGSALMGLLIALLSYAALWTINPAFVQFGPLTIGVLKKIDLDLDIEEVHIPSGAKNVGTGCQTATKEDVLSLVDAGTITGPADKIQQIKDGKIDERILGAIKTLSQLCPQAGTRITSLVRPKDTGSDHATGRAVDFGGTLCGGTPQELCANGKTLIETLKAQGYDVGTWDACHGSFVDRGKGSSSPHLHIESSPCP